MAGEVNTEHENEIKEMNNRINDSFVNVTGKAPTKQQIKLISEKLPESVKILAGQWGWYDTEVGDYTYIWIRDNIEEINKEGNIL